MTEIPEHLLKRAAERRAAMSGGGDAAAEAPAEKAPAADAGAAPAGGAAVAPKAKAAAPLPTLQSETAPPPPDSPVVAAARNRKRVPFWAASVLALLPLWAFIYVYSVQPAPAGANDPFVIGAEAYSSGGCAGCHGASGAGSSAGQKLNEGHVLETFESPLTMAHWIAFGAPEGARENGTYGDKDRPGGAMRLDALSGAMPARKDVLTPEELAAVVIYVREQLSGGTPEDSPELNSETFAADPEAAAAQMEAVIEAGPGGDPDLSEVPVPAG